MLYCTSLCSRPIENNLPAIQWLDRSEVVHNILVGPVLQHPELGQLGRGDGDGLEEVDPVDDLHAAGGGQGARVGAEGSVLHVSYQVCDLDTIIVVKFIRFPQYVPESNN